MQSSMRSTLILGLLSLALAGCTTARAPLGEGLHGPVKELRAEFVRRVKGQFPIGSDEAVLRAELLRQDFAIVRDRDAPFSFSATYHSGGIACVEDWNVRWSVYAGRIADIEGNWGQTCL
jgi:hypothetical protein